MSDDFKSEKELYISRSIWEESLSDKLPMLLGGLQIFHIEEPSRLLKTTSTSPRQTRYGACYEGIKSEFEILSCHHATEQVLKVILEMYYIVKILDNYETYKCFIP